MLSGSWLRRMKRRRLARRRRRRRLLYQNQLRLRAQLKQTAKNTYSYSSSTVSKSSISIEQICWMLRKSLSIIIPR